MATPTSTLPAATALAQRLSAANAELRRRRETLTNAVSQAQQSEKEALRRLEQSAAAARLAVDQRKRTNAAAWTAAHSSGLGSSETPAARKAVLDAPVSTSESDSDAES